MDGFLEDFQLFRGLAPSEQNRVGSHDAYPVALEEGLDGSVEVFFNLPGDCTAIPLDTMGRRPFLIVVLREPSRYAS